MMSQPCIYVLESRHDCKVIAQFVDGYGRKATLLNQRGEPSDLSDRLHYGRRRFPTPDHLLKRLQKVDEILRGMA